MTTLYVLDARNDSFNDDNNFNFNPNINYQIPNFDNNIRPPVQSTPKE